MSSVQAQPYTQREVVWDAYADRVRTCPYDETSAAGSEECVCDKGFTKTGGLGRCHKDISSAECADAKSHPDVPYRFSSLCQLCARGHVKTDIGDHACSACGDNMDTLPAAWKWEHCLCNAGYTAAASGVGCEACASGTYKAYSGNVSCWACPQNSDSAAASIARTNCRCDAGYTGADGGPCVPCAQAEFKSSQGSAACDPCPANTVSPSGSTQLAACQCNAGYTGADGAGCTACAANTFKHLVGADACHACAANSASPEGSTTSSACVCNAGHSGPHGGPCAQCAAGTFKSSPGSESCVNCAIDTFSLPAATSCAPCGEGAEANEGSAACVCSAGHEPVGSACRPCQQGYEKATAGNVSCSACAENSFSAGGEALCQNCPPNSVAPSPAGLNACLCVQGYERTGDSCRQCVAGKVKAGDSNTVLCTFCEKNKYQHATAQSSCHDCPASSTTEEATGSTSVEACLCNAGFEPAGDGCTACSEGFFCPGSDAKTQCPGPNGIAPPGSTSRDACECPAGTYMTADEASCDQCPPDSYCAQGTRDGSAEHGIKPCQESSSAPAGSKTQDACVCVAGFRVGDV